MSIERNPAPGKAEGDEHEWASLLPSYAAGSLPAGQRRAVQAHLAECPACREDLALWTVAGNAVVAADQRLPAPSPAVLQGALERVHGATAAASGEPLPGRAGWTARLAGAAGHSLQLLQAQVPLVRREIWPASAGVIALGYLVTVMLAPESNGFTVLSALAPLAAAGSVAAVYGRENDPALELALATPTSSRQVLLARLVLVFGFDLVLTLLASAALLVILPAGLLGQIILGWLGPMTLLSSLALWLSLLVGTGNAVTVALLLWVARLLARGMASSSDVSGWGAAAGWLARIYNVTWANPALQVALAAGLLAAALWAAGRQESMLSHA